MERHDFLMIKLMCSLFIYINILKNLFNRQSSENCLRIKSVDFIIERLSYCYIFYAFIIYVSKHENISENIAMLSMFMAMFMCCLGL